MKIKNLISNLEFFYPPKLAYEWDNIGLLVGDDRTEITNVLTALEVTNEVINEAIERDCNLIVSHHPLIFKPLKSLDSKDPIARLIIKLIKNDIGLYSMHTNVDIAFNGMNDWLATLLKLNNKSVLVPTTKKEYCKIEIEVSKKDLDFTIELLKSSNIGLKGKKISDITIKDAKKILHLEEKDITEFEIFEISSFIKIEDIPEMKQLFYVNNLFNYRLIKLENLSDVFGIGRYGNIKTASLEQLAFDVKEKFGLETISMVGSSEQIIKKVAIVGGCGTEFIDVAKSKGCDCLITGDIKFHDAQYALSKNIALLDPGHAIEIVFNDYMADFISYMDQKAFASEIDTNPFEVL